MSAPEPVVYEVDLVQLTPDATNAGVELPPHHLDHVTEDSLRKLLTAAAVLAPQVTYPLAPEIRITAPTGKFLAPLKEGRLRFVSWAAAAKSLGHEPTVDQMLSIIRGDVPDEDAGSTYYASSRGGGSRLTGGKRIAAIVGLLLVVLAVNAFTVTQAKKPPGNFLPAYHVMETAPGDRVLASVAGNYETGAAPGDRQLQIGANGSVVWIKFGPGRSVREQKTFTLRPVEVNGAPALLTSKQGLIKIKDPATLILFGDTYVRILK